MFKINHLDHVAIYVSDMDISIAWYEKVLGLKKHQYPEWGAFPVFMLAGTTGVAIFPANPAHPSLPSNNRGIRIEHFAFNVDNDEFQKARAHYEKLGISYEFKDHQLFHSIYTYDPDGHNVELTTLVVPPERAY